MRKKKIGNQSNERQRKKNYIIVAYIVTNIYIEIEFIFAWIQSCMYGNLAFSLFWLVHMYTIRCWRISSSSLCFFFLNFFRIQLQHQQVACRYIVQSSNQNERQNHDAEHLGCNVKNIRRSPIIIIKNKKKLEHIASASPLWYKYRTFFFSFHVTM